MCTRSSVDRATASGAVCRGFDSLRVRFYYFSFILYLLFPLFFNSFLYFVIFFLLQLTISFLLVPFNEFFPAFLNILLLILIFFRLWQFLKQFFPIVFIFFPIVTSFNFLQPENASAATEVTLYLTPPFVMLSGMIAFFCLSIAKFL